jgi:dienelactone hydrolase
MVVEYLDRMWLFWVMMSSIKMVLCTTLLSTFVGLATSTLAQDVTQLQPFERVTIPVGDEVLNGALYVPSGPGPFPAVIALHGCGGLYNASGQPSARHADWGVRLAKQGFLVLLPDSFGSRGLGSQCGVQERKIRASRERVTDAIAVKEWLQQRSDVKAGSVSLLGWSNGGSVVLAAIRSDRRGSSTRPDFAKAVAFYPGCRVHYENPNWRTRIPLLVLMGDADDWTPPGPCSGLVDSAQTRGEDARIILYKGAFHDFDHPSLKLREREGLAFTANGTGKASAGTDPAAREDALIRVPAFLAR